MFKQVFFIAITLSVSSLATAQSSKRATALYQDGIRSEEKGMFPEAMLSFKKAIALNKMYDSAHVEIGNIYTKAGKTDSAIFHYNKAIAINPGMVAALLPLGNIYRDAKPNYDSAIICYLSALKTDNTNKVTYYSLAWCYNTKKDYDNAIIYAIKSLDIDNNYKPSYNELGHAYNASKKYAEGVVQFKKFFAASKNELPAYYCGLCYITLKDKEAALQMYDELKKIESKRADALKKRIDAMQ